MLVGKHLLSRVFSETFGSKRRHVEDEKRTILAFEGRLV